jgi:putative component of membrane protein insertase Oxa1/YidC/SpoIIIJ protein YidD
MKYCKCECEVHGKQGWKEYTSSNTKGSFQPCCSEAKVESIEGKSYNLIKFGINKYRRCVKLFKRGHAWITESANEAIEARKILKAVEAEEEKRLKRVIDALKKEEGLETPRSWTEFFTNK